MNTLLELSSEFFTMFAIETEQNSAEAASDKLCFEKAMSKFLNSGLKEDAFVVYLCFCEIFKLFGQGYSNTKKLLELLSDHEYHSGELLSKHRDHYSHSVYVFALGLAIYANDASFRHNFLKFYGYDDCEKSNLHFLKYWGIVSLFHDIGYPFQLAHEQIKTYSEEVFGKSEDNLFVSFGNLDKMIALDEDTKNRLTKAFDNKKSFNSINELLAYGLEVRLGYDSKAVCEKLIERVVEQRNFMDHAYFSSVLLARKLFSVPEFKMDMHNLDVLTAILLHNNFNKYDAPGRRPISVSEHPLSYLLILCDELQCWDRMAYGKISKRDPIAWDISLNISDNYIKVKYIFDSYIVKEINEENGKTRVVLNKNYVELEDGIFVEKIFGTKYLFGDATESQAIEARRKVYEGYIVSSLKLETEFEEKKKIKKANLYASDDSFINLYDLAKFVHISYSDHCRNFNGTRIDEDFGKLPLEFKISNIEQAKSYAYKLELINCFYSRKDLDYPVVTDFNNLVFSDFKDNCEFLCREEHVRWVKEKLSLGWKYGTDYKDVEERNRKKIHKSILPYDELPNEEKSKDELMIKNMFTQLQKFESNIKIYNYRMGRKPKLEIAGTGHRYFISDPKLLKNEIKGVLKKYSENYLVIVRTCFAYGADQLIAECAIELGITIKADLPMEYETYINNVREDAIKNGHLFTEDDELRMRHLLAQTVVCKPIPDPVFKYVMANKYIVDKCDVLIALWDGKEMKMFDDDNNPINRGGTYDCIRMAREQKKKIHIIDCFR